jgi:hypothetical protein
MRRLARACRPGVFGVCLGLALFVLGGCRNGSANGTVSGRVLAKGERVPLGTVLFFSEHKVVGSGEIRQDGTYRVDGVPPGEVHIVVAILKKPMDVMLESLSHEMAGRPDGPPSGMRELMRGKRGPGGRPRPPRMPRSGRRGPGMGGEKGGGMGGASEVLARIPPDKKKDFQRLDAKYADPDKSPLTYAVVPGQQTHDIELSPD